MPCLVFTISRLGYGCVGMKIELDLINVAGKVNKESHFLLSMVDQIPQGVDSIPVKNPLKELFGFSKGNKITKPEFLETRTWLEKR